MVNEDRIKNFQATEAIVIADELINEKTDGTTYLDIMISTPNEEGLFNPAYLKKIEDLQVYVESLSHVKGKYFYC